ncbi:response regulator [Bdellovibrio sp. HCB209]|uniref:response regulator n=1 Tax=Bdellovibrio sp. HCB209 TaxID=3394354 RepID=UPI0039B3AAA7
MTSTPTSRIGKLLIIDDEEDLREVLTVILEDSAQQIDTAANGIEGIEKLKTGHYDAVLSDEKMPKKSGIEVLKWMRENGINTPFIMHTGYGQKDIMQEAQRLGVFALIDKPWDEKKLIKTVETALQSGTSEPK